MKILSIIVLLLELFMLSGCSTKVEEKINKIGDLTFIGRSSVRIDLNDGRSIYIDPYMGSATDYEKEGDLVLVTHQHSDHNNIAKVKLKDKGSVIQCPIDIKAGDSKTVDGIKITAVYAYNSNHAKESCCGFILEIDGVVIYHSGDTSLIDEMATYKDFNIDYALICIDGVYNMDPEEAMEVAALIKPRVVIPIHSAGSGLFDEENLKLFKYEASKVLYPSGSIELLKVN